MTTITIKVPVTPETEEKTVTLPYYSKSFGGYYAVIDKTPWGTIHVRDNDEYTGIARTVTENAVIDTYPSTEAEFLAAYARTEKKLRALAGIAERATTEA